MTQKQDKYLNYALADPHTNEIRYIGKSCRGLQGAKKHFSRAYLTDIKRSSIEKINWIKGCIEQGVKPTIVILRVGKDAEDVAKYEKIFITKYRKKGMRLFNIADGGVGGDNKKAYRKWKPVFAKNLKTGKEIYYRFVWETAKDGFSPTKVSAVCRGRRLSHKGFLFRYVDKDYHLYKPKIVKPIKVIIKKTKQELTFSSITEAAKELKITPNSISINLKKRLLGSKYEYQYL